MRRDTQIGVILGMVILVIIGVFLSTRSSFKEADMPVLLLPEESMSVVEEIDISDLAQEPKSESLEQEIPAEETVIAEELSIDYPDEEPLKYGTLLEGKWKGIVPELKDKQKELFHIQQTEKESGRESDLSMDQDSLSDVAEETSDVAEETSVVTDAVPVDTDREVIHTVRSNESLAVLSKKYYGDKAKWRVIFEANRDKMSNPDVLYVGLRLKIPSLSDLPQGSGSDISKKRFAQRINHEAVETRNYKIRRGDTLHSIAAEFYEDGSLWWKIYEANEDKIEDKNFLIIGRTLVIPE
ncbi:MAG: LysM peptidoglycan-binding domain-containing protein [Candidatus Scalindua sp.]|nr:LysM peptidoglycan-binding domain-containing protein [Candidatus Scalindua sp.]